METIVVKDWRLKFLASVGNDLMYYDIAEVNSVYKCAGELIYFCYKVTGGKRTVVTSSETGRHL